LLALEGSLAKAHPCPALRPVSAGGEHTDFGCRNGVLFILVVLFRSLPTGKEYLVPLPERIFPASLALRHEGTGYQYG